MKVLLVNGSPRPKSNTLLGLEEMQKIFNEQGIETEMYNIGNKDIRGCIACGQCSKLGHCVFDDVVNKFFTISGMQIASSQYWNNIHGGEPGEAVQDEEGMQVLRVLARNMSFLIKSIALGKGKFGLPEKEKHLWTNFI